MADYVRIYDGPEQNEDKLLLRTCGSQTIDGDSGNQTRFAFSKPLKSQGNEMLVVMDTDSDVQAKGFSARYKTVFLVFGFLFLNNFLDISLFR